MTGHDRSRSRASRAFLLDDVSVPDGRRAFRGLLRHATSADIAVARMRLAAIDFREPELAGLECCRVVLGQFDVHALVDAVEAASGAPTAAANLGVLQRFMASGRLEIRSAGARRWRPDFCVLRGARLRQIGAPDAATLVGHLGIGGIGDGSGGGPSLTCVLAGKDATDRAGAAFERLWTAGHDVLDVVADTLSRYAGRS